ncbi:hypothetical protein BDN71DRAFT_1448070 [Pleurotus eryngii]|uniref:NADH dehydrogenase [ubiquinone] 1 alpha subcomplex subunit n=1 Tax=Pleurotus eryngii TaxID=5323 RepID=A0A9P5ZUZ8_PLEER|nr:hypothetical protein BDN71DRAFT_1448070 [Pleurotus eryngii]
MSFLRRLWNMVGINKPTRFVGGDLEGNRYYEWANPNNASRTRRSVKYYKEDDMWLYVGGQKRLAVQWSSWLSHTRAHPPTIEELQADVLRQQKVQHNAALIEAKEQHERQEALRIGGGVPPAISDSDHRAEPHASHEAIHPQRLAANEYDQLPTPNRTTSNTPLNGGDGHALPDRRPNDTRRVDDTIPWTPQS